MDTYPKVWHALFSRVLAVVLFLSIGILSEDLMLITFIQQMLVKLEPLLSAKQEIMAMFMKEWLDTVTKRRFQAPSLYIDTLEVELIIFIPKALFHMKFQDTYMKEFNVMFTDKHSEIFL